MRGTGARVTMLCAGGGHCKGEGQAEGVLR